VSGLTRRGFIGLAAVAGVGAGIGAPLLAGLRGSASTGVVLPSMRPVPTRFTVPLTLPPVLKPGHADETGDHYQLTRLCPVHCSPARW
jgi:spore coat protein A